MLSRAGRPISAIHLRDLAPAAARPRGARLRDDRLREGAAACDDVAAMLEAVNDGIEDGEEGEETERALEALAGSVASASDDLKIGIAAFRNKTKPQF